MLFKSLDSISLLIGSIALPAGIISGNVDLIALGSILLITAIWGFKLGRT